MAHTNMAIDGWAFLVITVKANFGGVERTFGLLADALSPGSIKKALGKISKAKQHEVRQRFEQGGPGWEPLKPASIVQRIKAETERLARTQETAIAKIGKKLTTQLAQAQKRSLRAVAKTGQSNVRASTIERRHLEIAVFKALRSGGVLDGKLQVKVAAHIFARALKRQAGMKAHGILGKIANSIQATIENETLVIFSRIEWSDAQNSGGQVGNRAVLPARTFLEWTTEDGQYIQTVFEEHMILAFAR